MEVLLHGYLGVWDCGDPKWGVLPLHSGVPFCPLPELSWPKEFISFVFFFFTKILKIISYVSVKEFVKNLPCPADVLGTRHGEWLGEALSLCHVPVRCRSEVATSPLDVLSDTSV